MAISINRRRFRLSGNALATLGQKAGFLTGEERAKACKVSRSHLMHVERGSVWPSADLIDRMAAAYNRPVELIERAAAEARESLARRMLDQARGIE